VDGLSRGPCRTSHGLSGGSGVLVGSGPSARGDFLLVGGLLVLGRRHRVVLSNGEVVF